MDFTNLGINWKDPQVINAASSGDVVGTINWLNTEYNIIKAIRKWRPVYDWDDNVSFWLDKDLSVSDFIKEENPEITNLEIWEGLGISPGVVGSDSFFNALMTSESYKAFIHPAMELPSMDDFGRYFNNGRPSYAPAHEAMHDAYNAINFNEGYRYWVDPPYITGGFWGSEIISKSTSQRTVKTSMIDCDCPTWPCEHAGDGFNYILHYFYKRRLMFLKNGTNYEAFTFPNANFETLDDDELKTILENWVIENEIAEPGTTEWERIFWFTSGGIWLLGYIIERTIKNWGHPIDQWDFSVIWIEWQKQIWFLMFNLAFLQVAQDLDNIDEMAMAPIRLKINSHFVPDIIPESTRVYTDPIFFGSGY